MRMPHTHFGLVRTLILIVVTVGTVGTLLFGALFGETSLRLVATVQGPCTEYEAQTATAEVTTVNGEHLAFGSVGRWRFVNGNTCTASIRVDDIPQQDDYRVNVGTLTGDVDVIGPMDTTINLRQR